MHQMTATEGTAERADLEFNALAVDNKQVEAFSIGDEFHCLDMREAHETRAWAGTTSAG